MGRSYVLVRKSDSFLMKTWAFLTGFFMSNFMSDYWTTLVFPFSKARVYVPESLDWEPDWGKPSFEVRHRDVLIHELVHVDQFNDFTWPGFLILYAGPSPFLAVLSVILAFLAPKIALFLVFLTLLCLPLTVGLAWGRYYLEREAYVATIKYAPQQVRAELIKWAAMVLWEDYLFAWPKKWSENWFSRQNLL